jgi:hypothetical protein
LSVNVPSDTASSGSGSIYLQISAPSGTQWIGFGQGSQMSGANMLVVYAADSSNVTVSPRLGTGHVEPDFNSDANIAVLDGTGISSDGTLVANIRCDTCLSWSGGSMDPTDTSSSWIFAHKSGDDLDATSQSAQISQHDSTGGFTLDLTTGTGGSSSNPFVASSASASASASASSGGASQTASGTTATASAASTSGVSAPLASTDPSSTSSGASSVSEPNHQIRVAHAVIMPLVFVVLFPLAALTLYLPYSQKVRHIHAPLQVLSLILMVVGFGLGVELAKKSQELDMYHQVIGYIVVAWMVVAQPALGLGQHLYFRKNGARSPMGHVHRWVGRAIILLGVVNGGLGLKQAGAVGSTNTPTYSVVIYSIVAVVIFIVYLLVVLVLPAMGARRNGSNSNGSLVGEKPRPRIDGYEMHGRSVDNSRSRGV